MTLPDGSVLHFQASFSYTAFVCTAQIALQTGHSLVKYFCTFAKGDILLLTFLKKGTQMQLCQLGAQVPRYAEQVILNVLRYEIP